MLHIHSKKIVLLILLIGASGMLWAQKYNRGGQNFLDFQKKPYYFGITLGYNSSNYLIKNSQQFILHDSIRRTESVRGPGFDVHMVNNLKIGEYFDFRFLPGFVFSGRQIEYTYLNDPNGVPQTESIETIFVELPFLLRYKSAPYKDMRMFVVGGVKYAYDVASNARARRNEQNKVIRVSPHDFGVEFGAGMQFFFPFFIFSPEIKFSQGLGNALIYNNGLQKSTVLEKIFSRSFTISFHFEG